MYLLYEPSNNYEQSKNNNFSYIKIEKYIKIDFHYFLNSILLKYNSY